MLKARYQSGLKIEIAKYFALEINFSLKEQQLQMWSLFKQGCHFPDNMKFPDFSRPRLSSTVSPRLFRGVLGHAPPENFQN